ncbi:hypothetical protein NEOC95_000666 [Neochlamydia sp. AcF95]|nr:hypothetical protein [Neochlamydia sp. AcF95]
MLTGVWMKLLYAKGIRCLVIITSLQLKKEDALKIANIRALFQNYP